MLLCNHKLKYKINQSPTPAKKKKKKKTGKYSNKVYILYMYTEINK